MKQKSALCCAHHIRFFLIHRRLVLERDEWDRFAIFDLSKNYTRNLIATDGEVFTLLLLCWNPGRESPIHDHPCDGCWMRLCEGSVQECRFVQEPDTDRLNCISDNIYQGKFRQANVLTTLGCRRTHA